MREVALAHAEAGLIDLLHTELPDRLDDPVKQAACRASGRGHWL